MKRWIPVLVCLLLAVSAFAYVPERKPFRQIDTANRLTNMITPLGRETQIAFDSRGLVCTVREPSGQFATNSYDARTRLTNCYDFSGPAAGGVGLGRLTVRRRSRNMSARRRSRSSAVSLSE